MRDDTDILDDLADAMLLGRSRTVHWFDPCRPEHRTGQRGGGWRLATDD